MTPLAPALLLAASLAAAPGATGTARPAHEALRLADDDALEDVWVLPRRPGQNRVRWWPFEFREYPLSGLPGAGVRLWAYDAEHEIAETAAGILEEDYRRLAIAFDLAPPWEIPYVLYATQAEFGATNAFPIDEGVLGVTSPDDLTMALPFFGDLALFRHTSSHELAHQFTIQSVRAHAPGLRGGGLSGLPLWFIEGLAEYAAYGGLDPDAHALEAARGASGLTAPGLDPDAEAWARDLLFRPVPLDGWLRLDFFSDQPRGWAHTYKLGQLRVAFLRETFGRPLLLWLLRNAHRLSAVGTSGPALTFPALLEAGTGFTPPAIVRMFDDWLVRRFAGSHAAGRTRPPALELVDGLPVEIESVVASADGRTVLARGFDRDEATSSLWLLDGDRPARAQRVVEDGTSALESLHLLSRRTFALGPDRLAWLGRVGAGDALFVASLRRRPEAEGEPFEIGPARVIELPALGLAEAGDPAFSPDGHTLAFTAIPPGGHKDVYTLALDAADATPRRITDDLAAESGLQFTPEGLLAAIDATPDARPNLFRLDPATGARTPLAAASFGMSSPTQTPEGLLFAGDAGGRADLFRLEQGRIVRLTASATFLRSPAPAPRGALFAVTLHGGRLRLARVPPAELLAEDEGPALDPSRLLLPPWRPPRRALPREESEPYEPLEHFGPDAGLLSIGSQAVAFGAFSFADRLRDHVAVVQAAVYDDPSLTDASLYWVDRSSRVTWLGGLFHSFEARRDRSFPSTRLHPQYFLERSFGVSGGAAYPLSSFDRVELEAGAAAVVRERYTDHATRDLWRERTGGAEPRLQLRSSFGHDTVRWLPGVGPASGASLWLTVGGDLLPQRFGDDPVHATVELDAQRWFHPGDRVTVMGRAAAGTSFGGRFAPQFRLSSVDNLRGLLQRDERLIGGAFTALNLELGVPLDWLVRLALFEGIRGVVGADAGAVADRPEGLWEARVLAAVLGVDLFAGPALVRVHFGRPIEIGPFPTEDGWVTNVALRLRY